VELGVGGLSGFQTSKLHDFQTFESLKGPPLCAAEYYDMKGDFL
jgi:hypothetical protein